MSPVPLDIRPRPIVDDNHPSRATLSACTHGDSTPITALPPGREILVRSTVQRHSHPRVNRCTTCWSVRLFPRTHPLLM